MNGLLGAKVAAGALVDPVLDSQNRFYGVAFPLYGVLLYLSATDLSKYASLVRRVFVGVLRGRCSKICLHRNLRRTVDAGTVQHGVVSVIPAIIGIIGQRIRKYLSEQVFRRVFFVLLIILGAYTIADAFEVFR